MEYKILNESLVYYACKNSEGIYFPLREYIYEKKYGLNQHTRLYKNKGNAEEYGKRYGYPEVVKVKLVEIE